VGEDSEMSKPVAWMKTLPDGTVYGFGQTKTNDEFDIPLYTHSAKELTDEKIYEVWKQTTKLMYRGVHEEFARAILRKAQEK
jgi:hypothetical protein